jgi:hypothetical protein
MHSFLPMLSTREMFCPQKARYMPMSSSMSTVSNPISLSEPLYVSGSIHYNFLKIFILGDTTSKKIQDFLPVNNISRLGSPLKTKNTVHYFLIIKPTICTNFSNLFWK